MEVNLKRFLGTVLAFILLFSTVITTEAASATKVMWGNIEVKKGVIGKVQVVKDTTLYKLEKNKLKPYQTIKKGTESAIYEVKNQFGTIYSIGSNIYYKSSSDIKYYKIPKEIAAKIAPPTAVPDVSYLSQALPSVKFGMTSEEVEKAFNQKLMMHSQTNETYGIIFLPQLKKIFLGYDKEIIAQFKFQNNRLYKVNLSYAGAPYLETANERKNRLNDYVNEIIKPFKTPIQYTSNSNSELSEGATIKNKKETLTISVISFPAEEGIPATSTIMVSYLANK